MPELCRQHNGGLLKQYGDLFATSLVDDSLVPIKINTAEEEETFNTFTYARKNALDLDFSTSAGSWNYVAEWKLQHS